MSLFHMPRNDMNQLSWTHFDTLTFILTGTNRPDIVKEKICFLIDMAVPSDKNIC